MAAGAPRETPPGSAHLLVEGDNLPVLTALADDLAGGVALAYLDPPYNTGGPLAFADDFRRPGDAHGAWVEMLRPRLEAVRPLLRPDGAVAISIDDRELARLLLLCEEVFGDDAVVNVIVVKSSETSGVKMAHASSRLPKVKEYVVLVAADRRRLRLTPIRVRRTGAAAERYLRYYTKVIVDPTAPVEAWELVGVRDHLRATGTEPTEDAVRAFQLANAERVVYRTNNRFLAGLELPTATAAVTSPTGVEYVWWEGRQMLFLADHLTETLGDLWTDLSTINLRDEVLGVDGFGAGQKPLALLERLIALTTSHVDAPLILDPFAGSGTTGHAVMAANAADGGRRRSVLVQRPDPLDPDQPSQRAAAAWCDAHGLPRTLAALTAERLRRAAAAHGVELRHLAPG